MNFDDLPKGTAKKFQHLASLRGVEAKIEWDGKQYLADGEPCGPSVHGLYEWLDKRKASR